MSQPTFNLTQLIRPDIAGMESYTPILPFEVLSAQLNIPIDKLVKLDANENPYGPSPSVKKALAEYPFMHIYPDPESRELREALAQYTGVGAEYLLVGHGADELLDLVMRLFLSPGDAIINCPPTFGMYSFDAAINAAKTINITRRADFSLDIEGIISAVQANPQAKLLFVTSPNNPDGSVISASDLKKLLNLPIVVILDEAYTEFYGHSFIDWAVKYPNLIVLRTFSKWAGLAGLRVGYGAFPPDIIEHLWKIKQPYNVNIAGQVAALASLQDTTRLLQNVDKIVAARNAFQTELKRIPWLHAYPSQSNFILARVLQGNAAQIKTRLAQRGILVRYYTGKELADCLRFSIGAPQQMARLLEELLTL